MRVQEYHPQCFSPQKKTFLVNGKVYDPHLTSLEARENQPHFALRRGSMGKEGIWVQVRGRGWSAVFELPEPRGERELGDHVL